MRKNAEHIVHLFLDRRAGGNDTLSTDGNVIRSYDMPIAQRLPDGRIEVISRDAGPTATTRTHISGVSAGLNAHGAKEVPQLTGHAPHVFRDRAGQRMNSSRDYLSRSNTPLSYARRPAVPAAPAPRRLKLVK